jgi:hypothetical protein
MQGLGQRTLKDPHGWVDEVLMARLHGHHQAPYVAILDPAQITQFGPAMAQWLQPPQEAGPGQSPHPTLWIGRSIVGLPSGMLPLSQQA